MLNRRSQYTPEFRAEAVRLYRSVKREKSMRQVATELGISNETLRSWIKQDHTPVGEVPTFEELDQAINTLSRTTSSSVRA